MIVETPPTYEEPNYDASPRNHQSPTNNTHRRPTASQTSTPPSPVAEDVIRTNDIPEKVPHRDHETASQATGTIYGDHDENAHVHTPPSDIFDDDYMGLPLEEARCSLLPNRSAAWSVQGRDLILCTLAATVLVKEGYLHANHLKLYQPHLTRDSESPEPTDPISGVLSAAHGTVGGVIQGVADYPIEISRMLKENDRSLSKGMAADFALDKGKGVSRIVGTGLRAPMDFTLNISKGFHNVPKLYGDSTVRETEKVTGLGSGFKAAGKGFGLGLYDGISGIFTQPYKGAKENGIVGGLMGFGKGIGGAVCKPAAGAVGLPAYAFKGVYEEVHKNRGFSMENHMAAAQAAQGQQQWEVSTEQERNKIVKRWLEAQTSGFHREKFQ